MFGGEEYSAVKVHQGGYLTFNGSASSGAVDCLNATAYEDDVVVALCSRKMITLVNHPTTLESGPTEFAFVEVIFGCDGICGLCSRM